MVGVMALTLVVVAPVAAQDEEECRGGGPEYWSENPWPAAFTIPKLFQNPNKSKRTVVRGWTRFNDVFRWRKGKDQEGKIFSNKYRLRQALKGKGTLLKSLGKQTTAALLNAGAPNNEFAWGLNPVIKNFQIYWDGTSDMSASKARKWLRGRFRDLNEAACPTS
jgi:hypothetical protein